MKRLTIILDVLVLGLALALPGLAAADDTHVTAGAGGTYPPGTSFTGIDVEGLQVGFGAEIAADGSALGNLTVLLIGPPNPLGDTQIISLQGQVTGGARNATNIAVLSGTASLDLGDGLPPTPDVPFTATLVKDPATNQGTVGLAIGFNNLPSATLNEGSISIKTVPPEPAGEEPAAVADAGP
jgi:hypothetical protein